MFSETRGSVLCSRASLTRHSLLTVMSEEQLARHALEATPARAPKTAALRRLDFWDGPSSLLNQAEQASLGIAIAMRRLARAFPAPQGGPAVLDETQAPLCHLFAPESSFPWEAQNFGQVPVSVMHEFVMLLGCTLNMVESELVRPRVSESAHPCRPCRPYRPRGGRTRVLNVLRQAVQVVAYTLVEEVLRKNLDQNNEPLLVGRPLLMGACVIALKITNDKRTTTRDCCSLLRDHFTGLTQRHLHLIELTLMETLDWRLPSGTIYQVMANALFEAAAAHTSSARVAVPRMLEEVA